MGKVVPVEKLQDLGDVLCHGTFDGYHVGHLRFLKEAMKYGRVSVTITGDKYVRHHGIGRPVFPEELRAEVIAAIDGIRFVAIVQAETGEPAIRVIQPAIYCKGSETRREGNEQLLREVQLVESFGGKVVYIEKTLPYSSGLMLSGELLRRKIVLDKMMRAKCEPSA